MRIKATEGAFEKLNRYKLTDEEIRKEFEDIKKLDETHVFDWNMFFNAKNEDLIILPVGKYTMVIFEYGVELEGSYEDLPDVEYKDGVWIKKQL